MFEMFDETSKRRNVKITKPPSRKTVVETSPIWAKGKCSLRPPQRGNDVRRIGKGEKAQICLTSFMEGPQKIWNFKKSVFRNAKVNGLTTKSWYLYATNPWDDQFPKVCPTFTLTLELKMDLLTSLRMNKIFQKILHKVTPLAITHKMPICY